MMHDQTMQGGGGTNDRRPGVGNRNTDAQDTGDRGFFNDWDGGGAGGAHGPESGRQSGGNQQGQHKGRGPKNYRRSDARISDDVHEALTNDDEVDASEIEVSVSEGEVTLTGTVHTRVAKRRAEEILDDLAGISHVHNQLRVVNASNSVGG